jgi:predicted transcriptional regulator of viral defense system
MTTKLLLKKLYLSGKEFVTGEEIKNFCRTMNLDYKNTVNYLLRRGYLLRIFRGIFYLKSLDEIKFGKSKYNHLELVSKGLELKKVKNWYFALYTALKLNNLTHEHFAVDYVVSDKIFRQKSIEIAGYKFKFIKLKPDLFKFGIIKNSIRYSDPEKTILDFIYV